MVTDIARHLISLIKDRHNPQEKMGNKLQIFPWNVSDNKTDQ